MSKHINQTTYKKMRSLTNFDLDAEIAHLHNFNMFSSVESWIYAKEVDLCYFGRENHREDLIFWVKYNYIDEISNL